MGRYLTRRYVAVDWDEAVRLAGLDQTPIAEIRYAAEAELIHRTEWWAWWSDRLLTTATGLPESLRIQGLFPDAVELISSVWASNSPQPECGWSLLVQVRRILISERIPVEMDYTTGNSPRWERLSVELCDGQRSILYRLYVGDVDGYLCEIRTDPQNRFTRDSKFPLIQTMRLGHYLTLEELCTCTHTYGRYADLIDPFPQNPSETIPALQALCQYLLDPVIEQFGRERFHLTYGFCSAQLKRYLEKKDPVTGLKHGRIDPSRDQHMAHEKNRNGNYYCNRLGAACDFQIVGVESDRLVEWILEQRLPFDSLYYYGGDSRSETLRERPIHISYSPQQRQSIWTFTDRGVPTRKGIEQWLERLG